MPFPTLPVLNASNASVTINTTPNAGQATMANSLPCVLASDQSALAVTGTFWQATQPVSGTVTANAGTGTFAISAASLPLPAGAATAANQTALTALFPSALGQTTKAGSLSVTLPSDQGLLTTGGVSVVVGASFTRPSDTTAYTIGDLIANSTTAGSVTPIPAAAARINAGTGVIRRIRVSTSNTGLAGSEIIRVHLFKTSPTVTNGDNGAFAANGITSLALGFTDVVLNHVYNDGAKGFATVDIVFDAAGGSQNIYGLFEARTAFTPVSAATWTLALEVLQD